HPRDSAPAPISLSHSARSCHLSHPFAPAPLVFRAYSCIINYMNKGVDNTPAARVARDCFAVRLRLLNRIVTRIYDEALRPVGMTANQMNILAVLENMSEAQPSDLCRVLYMEKSTVSRNVERMRQQGWLRERPGPDAR